MSKVTISHKAIIKRKSLIIIMIIYGYKLDSFFITYPMFLPIPLPPDFYANTTNRVL